MTISAPLVSIFVPCFNQEAYIAQALDSALAQDYQHTEIVVGDDGSSDSTWAIVTDYQQRFPERIRAFRNERNLGITGNCNQILRRCAGKYVAFHAGDDVLLPTRVRELVDEMEAHGAVLGYHDIEVFDSSSGRVLRCWNSGPGSNPPVTGLGSFVAARLIERGTSFMASLSVMVLREACPAHGFDERVRVASDWLMWIDVCARASQPVVHIPKVLARYRRHASNVTADSLRHFDDELVTLALAEARYPEMLGSVEVARCGLHYKAGISHVAAGRSALGRSFLLRAMKQPGLAPKAAFRWAASLAGRAVVPRPR